MSVGRSVSSYGYEGYYTTNTSKVVVAFGFPRFFRQLRVYSKVAYIRSPSVIFAVLSGSPAMAGADKSTK